MGVVWLRHPALSQKHPAEWDVGGRIYKDALSIRAGWSQIRPRPTEAVALAGSGSILVLLLRHSCRFLPQHPSQKYVEPPGKDALAREHPSSAKSMQDARAQVQSGLVFWRFSIFTLLQAGSFTQHIVPRTLPCLFKLRRFSRVAEVSKTS